MYFFDHVWSSNKPQVKLPKKHKSIMEWTKKILLEQDLRSCWPPDACILVCALPTELSTIPSISCWADLPPFNVGSYCKVYCVPVNIEGGGRHIMLIVRGKWTGNVYCKIGNGWPKHFGRDCSPIMAVFLFCQHLGLGGANQVSLFTPKFNYNPNRALVFKSVISYFHFVSSLFS